MSMAKRLREMRTQSRRAAQPLFVGYHRGGKVTCSVDRDGYSWLRVRWSSGASWTLGPNPPRHDLGSWLRKHKVALMSFLKKLDHVAGVGPHELYIGEGMLATLPAIVEYLSLETFEDGSKRERSSLLVIVESGLLKVCLSDRQNARTLWRSGTSLEDVLLAMEVALQTDVADWRKSATKTVYGGKAKRT